MSTTTHGNMRAMRLSRNAPAYTQTIANPIFSLIPLNRFCASLLICLPSIFLGVLTLLQAQSPTEAKLPATMTSLAKPSGLVMDSSGNLYIAERSGHRILVLNTKTNRITILAGTGERGFGGDGGPATQARLKNPYGLALDRNDNLYIGDVNNHRIRKVDRKTGLISTVAGNGAQGFSGDGGAANSAQINGPYAIALDAIDNLFFVDTNNDRIRRVDARTGVITTVAGNGVRGFGGDGGPAIHASLHRPHVIEVDTSGNIFVGDTFNNRIRRVDAKNGKITTIAGTGEEGSTGDGKPATEASLNYMGYLYLDADCNLFVSDFIDQLVRRIDSATGTITTVAGNGKEGFAGDGGPAREATFKSPLGMAMDSKGNLYIADNQNNRVRRIEARTGIVTTIAGGGRTP